MSDPRHLLPLACTLVLAVSCASRPKLAAQPTPTAVLDVPRGHAEFERRMAELRLVEPQPQASNPYAPIRTRNADVYSWQSEKRAVCTLEPPAASSELERPLGPSATPGVLASQLRARTPARAERDAGCLGGAA